MATYEQCSCPLCSAEKPEQSRYKEGEYRIVRCQECKLWYLSPRLTQQAMQEYYARADYFEGGEAGYDSYANQEKSLRMTFAKLLENMSKRGIGGGSLLEVGCGYGYFLDEATKYFSKRVGTDYSEGAAKKSMQFADQVYVGGVDAVPSGEMFDCIVALHVVEHVYEPRSFIDALYSRLKPGGFMLFAVPDMGSWWRHAMGTNWPSFKYPEHVSYYDKNTLKQLMSTVNLVDHQSIPYPHAFPVSLVLNKLRLPTIPGLANRTLWMPATTVAFTARKPTEVALRAAA
jgi:2-polyprenyl-3-methyl-5-hydroxy-6-metoxy-1,4-benzoquinol methylase